MIGGYLAMFGVFTNKCKKIPISRNPGFLSFRCFHCCPLPVTAPLPRRGPFQCLLLRSMISIQGCCVHASIKHGNGQPATSNRRSLQGILSLVSPSSSTTDTTVHRSDRRKKTKHKHVTITPPPLAAPSVKACVIFGNLEQRRNNDLPCVLAATAMMPMMTVEEDGDARASARGGVGIGGGGGGGGDGVGKRDCFEPSMLSASSEGGDLWVRELE